VIEASVFTASGADEYNLQREGGTHGYEILGVAAFP
jgi:hypothetical protein